MQLWTFLEGLTMWFKKNICCNPPDRVCPYIHLLVYVTMAAISDFWGLGWYEGVNVADILQALVRVWYLVLAQYEMSYIKRYTNTMTF